jgi:RimJ/RimL family protein N-acetyltransferase
MIESSIFAELPPPLADAVLARAKSLPLKPAPITLTGEYVRLAPLVIERDLQLLFAASNGRAITLGERSVADYDAEKLIWRYLFAGPFASIGDFETYVQSQVDAPNALCLTVFEVATDRPVGMTNFMSNSPENLKIELGGIWYSPLVQRSPANTEATYLMLDHAFGLGYRRVEWKCNALNERSRRAALRMGFQFEGIQESHMIVKGRNRDTAWFRILAHEWPGVAAQLRTRLYEK